AWATLQVQDRGLGIPAADLPYVFERFRRGSNVGRIGGTGIGLAGAKQIVEQHDGSIAAGSAEGEGTTVTVRLPLAPGSRAGRAAGLPSRPAPAPSSPPPTTRPRRASRRAGVPEPHGGTPAAASS